MIMTKIFSGNFNQRIIDIDTKNRLGSQITSDYVGNMADVAANVKDIFSFE